MSQRNLANSRESGVVQKQPLNVYTVMLIVAFFAISIACLLLYLELKRWGSFPWWKAQTGGATAYIYQTESPESVSPVQLV
ncbi:MAG: hypothetical protein ACYC3X_14385 [Pirellulaceae bacterium]